MSEESTRDRGSHAASGSGNGALTEGQRGSAVQALGRLVADQVQKRIPTADLDERDPDYIRETLPGMWLLASFYFRADVKGLEKIPAEGPVLLVGNHSGGNATPDTLVFTLAFATYFGVQRPFFQLAHNLDLDPVGPERGRHAEPLAAAGEDQHARARPDRPAQGVRPPAGSRRGVRRSAREDAAHARPAAARPDPPTDRLDARRADHRYRC